MGAIRKHRPVLSPEGHDHLGEPLDRVGSLPGQRAVGGSPANGDAGWRSALFAERNRIEGLLANDHEVGLEEAFGSDVPGAMEAAGLFIRDLIDDQLALESDSGAGDGECRP